MIISRSFLLRMRNVSNVEEKFRTHILSYIIFSDNCALHEVMSKSPAKPDRP
jgi:hypothetical protein